MKINGLEFNAELGEILAELTAQLRINNIPLLAKQKETSTHYQVTCPYHSNGMERRPSAGIRKSDGKFHCLSGDTKVITREFGAVRIRDIVNQYVSILNGNGEWEFVRFENYGRQSLMRLILSCNTKEKVIYATDRHEWIVHNYNTKYQTHKLKPGMYLEKCVPKLRTDIKLDPKGIIHGFCYGDGNNFSHNKDKSVYYNRCFFYNESDLELKQYFVGDFRREVAANRKEYDIVYFRSDRDLKKVPDLTESDSYLLGFLAGYFVADGNCFNNKLTIYSHKYEDLYKIQQICTILGIMTSEIGVSNIKAGKRGCITVKEDTNGYTLRLVRNTIPDNFFITEKGRNSVQKYTGRQRYKVIKVERTDLEEYVYCCQTSTHSFALENFILTGNCFACGEVHELNEVISHCFGYVDDVLGKFGWDWLLKNFMTISVEERKDVQLDFSRDNVSNKVANEDHRLDNNHHSEFVTEEELDKYRFFHPYMFTRKLTEEIIELFDIGWDSETDCITFPVRDENGNCLFIARRSVKGKYFNYPNSVEKPLYGLYELHHVFMSDPNSIGAMHQFHTNPIIICESMLDALACWVYGKYAIALNGLGSEKQISLLNSLPCRKYILATDKDEKGKEARKRLRQKIKGKLITEYDYNSYPEHAKDINDMDKQEFQNLVEIF